MKMEKYEQIDIFSFLNEVEKEVEEKSEKQVMIEKAINLKLMCDYIVSCSYGDIVLIICMLRDYVKMLDEIRKDDIKYEVYYRDKFMKIADKLSEQIEYDYDAAVEKCKKKLKQKSSNDIGEDAMILANRYGKSKKKEKADENNEESQRTCSDERKDT